MRSAISVSAIQPEGHPARGIPLAIDAHGVAETGILPRLDAGIAHKAPDIGMVGAGVLCAPKRCFTEAFETVGEYRTCIAAVAPRTEVVQGLTTYRTLVYHRDSMRDITRRLR